MTGNSRLRILAAAGVMLAVFAGSASAQHDQRPLTVLTVFSVNSGTPYVVGPQRAFERTLLELLGRPVDFQSVHLDLTSEHDLAFEDSLANTLVQKYAATPVDLVMVHRVEALAFLLKYRATLLTGVPVVFTEVVARELQQLHLPADVTGVIAAESLHTVSVALDLFPQTRRFVVVGGGAAMDRRFAAALRERLKTGWPEKDVDMLDGLSVDEQRVRVSRLPPDSLILMGSYRFDAAGRAATPEAVGAPLAAAATGPMFGFHEDHLGGGLTGGHLLQLDRLAARAAELAAGVLRGRSRGSHPPVTESAHRLAFDGRQLDRWSIDESRLPAGSVALFREPTLWSQYRWQILGFTAVMIAEALLIGGLVIERRNRRRAQVSLADAEQRYRTVADTGADWDYWMQPDGSLLYVSPSCAAITGYDAAAFVARPELLTEIVLPEDRTVWSAHTARVRDLPGPTSIQFRIRTRGGDIRWIEHVSARVTSPDGRDLGMRGSNRDTTDRKQAEDALRRALAENEELRDRLALDNAYLREQLKLEEGLDGIIGESEAMRHVTAKVRQVAPMTTTVLLQGETGVGKSLVAHAIHNLSPRRERPLVTLNCAALPPLLIESELFGHEKGAFTGAQTRRLGRFEIADGGTLFLDEIGDLPLDLQAKLLRAVQDGTFERVGSNATLATDVRLIAATNRRLDDEVRAGRFRQDLLYRLDVFPITVPALRQRREDIPLLVAHFIASHCRALGIPPPQISKATLKHLQARPWPGNIRELENIVERGLIASRSSGRFEISAEDAGALAVRTSLSGPATDGQTLAQVERDHIVATLERVRWRIEGEGGAAEVLGINASTLRSRLRKHGIRRPADASASRG